MDTQLNLQIFNKNLHFIKKIIFFLGGGVSLKKIW